MTQITIDTNVIITGVITLFAIIGVIAIIGGLCYFVIHSGNASTSVSSTPAVISTPSYPNVLTFTVLSTTTSNGRYQVTTTSGNILYFADYDTWNSMLLRSTYIATIVGMDGIGYEVGTVNLLSAPSDYYYNTRNTQYWQGTALHDYSSSRDYPTYWHYNGKYYQCDRTACDFMNRKQLIGENVYEGKPLRPLRSGSNYY